MITNSNISKLKSSFYFSSEVVVTAPKMRKSSPDPIYISHRWFQPESLSNPTSPLERSPKGWKNRESDGVGLGIVAALDKSSSPNLVVNFHRVITISFPTMPTGTITPRRHLEEENCHGGHGNKGLLWDYGINTSDDLGFFCASPPILSDDFGGFPVAGFLRSCYLCSKKLDGKDIYMYRGEKSFCSSECRYRQIVADEYHEACSSEASRSSESSRSVHSGQRLFHTGIMAA